MEREKLGHIPPALEIKSERDEMTPKEQDFADVYPQAEIDRDLEKVAKKQQEWGIKNGEWRSSDAQEYTIVQLLSDSDWFSTEQDTPVFLTSKYDDYFNHIDAIAVLNEKTPFAIDMTYNAADDRQKLIQKFNWQHKKLGLPGFAEVKYFNDDMTYSGPLLPKGKIAILPRFIIGVSPELTDELTDFYTARDPWGQPRYEELAERVRFSLLDELLTQASGLRKSLDGRELPDSTREQVEQLESGFKEALSRARKELHQTQKYRPTDPEAAARRDPVVMAINTQAAIAYPLR